MVYGACQIQPPVCARDIQQVTFSLSPEVALRDARVNPGDFMQAARVIHARIPQKRLHDGDEATRTGLTIRGIIGRIRRNIQEALPNQNFAVRDSSLPHTEFNRLFPLQ